MNAERRLRPADPSVSPRFGDVATLLRAPRVPLDAGIDLALVGVPFVLGTNSRTGARGGPAAVREASRTIRLVHPTSRIAPFELCEVADVGDVAINAMDLTASLTAIEAFFQRLHSLHATPITVGGTSQRLMRTVFPTMSLSPPNARCQNSYPSRMAFTGPCRKSESANPRPATGLSPMR